MKTLKLTLIAAVAAAGMIATSAQAITFNSTGWLSNTTLTFNADAIGTATAAGVVLSPAGNATRLADAMGPDFTGALVPVPVYNFPVTSVSATVGLKITATAGAAVGSGVKMVRFDDEYLSAGLANFNVDLVKDVMTADVYTPQGTTTTMPLYKFTDDNNTVTKISGFTITSKGTVSKLIFTPQAVEAIATALELSDVLKATLQNSQWGGLKIDVSSKTRKPKTNGAVLTRQAMGIPLN